MCSLCELNRQKKLESGVGNSGPTPTRVIGANELIGEDLANFTRSQLNFDGFIDIYLHAPGGAVRVGGGDLGGQTISSLPISAADQEFISGIFIDLDHHLDLDFRFTNNRGAADIQLYYDTEIDAGGGGQALGIATTNSEMGRNWWEVFINVPAFANDQAYLRYALIHEFGHSLGLEHPFDNSDGDAVDGITNPWISAYPEDTVMAYRYPLMGSWPNAYSTNDLAALVALWGAETQISLDSSDPITGSDRMELVALADGDDLLRNLGGYDTFTGVQWEDQIIGGPGSDQLFAGLGNDFVSAGAGDDQLFGGAGDDQLWGGLGSDVFVISSGSDVVFDFRVSDGDRLGMSTGLEYSLAQQGSNMLVHTNLGITTIVGMNADLFDPTSMSIAV